jgi:3-oxoacyl-[acyl-carrier protein] reductase
MKPITLITGTRKGIGRDLAEYYLELGHTVLGCSRTQSDLRHDHYEHFNVDITDVAQTRKMFDQIKMKWGYVDHLINNAAIANMNHFMLTPVDSVEEIFKTNVVGSFLFCQEAARLMEKRKYGRIVNFSSAIIPLRIRGHAAYAASKAAVENFSKNLSFELAPFGITVNCVGPSSTRTDLLSGVPEEKLEELLDKQAIHRETKTADISHVIDFFFKRDSGFVTGQIIYLGGG